MQMGTRLPQRTENPLSDMVAGLLYVWRQRELRAPIMLIAVCSAFGASYVSFLPAFARDLLEQGSEGLGLLYGAVGAGALLGAYVLARVPDRHLVATPIVAAAAFGASLMAFSYSRWFAVSAALLLPVSFSLMLLGGSTNTLIQILARDDMRGRVAALYAMSFMGMMPWGSLVMGWVAGYTSVAMPVAVGGGVCILGAIATWLDRRGDMGADSKYSSWTRSEL
jgi:predicted MFS family arabinose efflux permease